MVTIRERTFHTPAYCSGRHDSAALAPPKIHPTRSLRTVPSAREQSPSTSCASSGLAASFAPVKCLQVLARAPWSCGTPGQVLTHGR